MEFKNRHNIVPVFGISGTIPFMKKRLESIEDLGLFADSFIRSVLEHHKPEDGALIVGLYGDLGSGKTAFVKQVATLLGIEGTVTSPTFVIEKIYKLPEGGLGAGMEHLIHIDAYRLDSGQELVSLGWEHIISGGQNIIFMEWPEQVKDILPEKMKKISFTFIDENTREVEW